MLKHIVISIVLFSGLISTTEPAEAILKTKDSRFDEYDRPPQVNTKFPDGSIEDIEKLLSRFGKKVYRHSHYDFGRSKFNGSISTVVPGDFQISNLFQLRKNLPKGTFAYLGTSRWLGDENPGGIELSVIPSNDQMDSLRTAKTDGINYDLYTSDVIRKLQSLDERFGISILQASTDTIQYIFLSQPKDVIGLSKELYEFCPDIVDQGAGTLKELQKTITTRHIQYFWWD